MSQNTVFFDEGAGFIFVKTLAQGHTGCATLVRSCLDGRLYVRKEDLDYVGREEHQTIGTEWKCAKECSCRREVYLNARVARLPNITACKGWIKFIDTRSHQHLNVTYWDYYNSGTFSDLMDMAAKQRILIPDEWKSNWLADMLTVLIDIHKSGVVRGDIHARNWFLNASNTDLYPKIGLGDWGSAQKKSAVSKSMWERSCYEDFSMLHAIFTSKKRRSGIVGQRMHNLVHSFDLSLKECAESYHEIGEQMTKLRDQARLFAEEASKKDEMSSMPRSLLQSPNSDWNSGYNMPSDKDLRNLKTSQYAEYSHGKLAEGVLLVDDKILGVYPDPTLVESGGWTQKKSLLFKCHIAKRE